MKTRKSADFNVFTDASLVNQTIQEAFQSVRCDECASKLRMDLTLEVLYDGGENNGNVLVSRTLSGFDLSGNHAVRAYQDLAREMPGLISKISAGKVLMRLSLETGSAQSS